MGYFRRFDQRIPFEYTTVSRMATCPEEYFTAKEVWISVDTALEVVQLFCKKYNISYKKMVFNINACQKGAWGGTKLKKTKNIPFMSIGSIDGHINGWIFCHEFAHVIHHNRWRQTKDMVAHGRKFTEILDRVITHFNTIPMKISTFDKLLDSLEAQIYDEKSPIQKRAQAVREYDLLKTGDNDAIGDDETLVADFIAEMVVTGSDEGLIDDLTDQ